MENLEKRIVQAARGWIGTRFHHQGRLKRTETHRGGVDCLGLLIGIARELDLRAPDGTPLAVLDKPDYGHFPEGEALKEALERLLLPVNPCEMQSGHIVLLAPDGVPRHVGIISEGPSLIHAYAQARKVVEHNLDAWWCVKIVSCYAIKPLASGGNAE